MSSFLRRFLSAMLGAATGGVMYAIWCGLFYYLHIYLLSPKNAGEWEKTGVLFFVALGLVVGAMIGCMAGLLRISRVNTALLACCLTSAFVLLLISDDLAYVGASSFRTLAFASALFHLIIGCLIGLACYDIRDRLTPQKLKKKRITAEIINLNPASSIPHRMPTLPKRINFSKPFEVHTPAPAIPAPTTALMTSLVLEIPPAIASFEETLPAERTLKINYRLLESFPNPMLMQDLHTGMLPAITRNTRITELPTAPLPKIIPSLATT